MNKYNCCEKCLNDELPNGGYLDESSEPYGCLQRTCECHQKPAPTN